jgi:hypothetical protein
MKRILFLLVTIASMAHASEKYDRGMIFRKFRADWNGQKLYDYRFIGLKNNRDGKLAEVHMKYVRKATDVFGDTVWVYDGGQEIVASDSLPEVFNTDQSFHYTTLEEANSNGKLVVNIKNYVHSNWTYVTCQDCDSSYVKTYAFDTLVIDLNAGKLIEKRWNTAFSKYNEADQVRIPDYQYWLDGLKFQAESGQDEFEYDTDIKV